MTLFDELRPVGEPQPGDFEMASEMFRALCPTSDLMRYVVIPGAPASKHRPRFGRGGKVYTPAEQQAAEKRTAWYLRSLFRDGVWTGNVAVGCVFFRPNRQRIDVDNLMKHVLDSANGVCWADDSQVTALMGRLEYDVDHPRSVVVFGAHESSMGRDMRLPSCARCGEAVSSFGGKFCSRACAAAARRVLDEPVACVGCGTLFRRTTTIQRYCTTACARRASVGRPRSTGGPPAPVCSDCGERVSKRDYIRCRSCYKAWRREASARAAS